LADFSAEAVQILEARYLKKDKDGNIIETPQQMLERVAQHIASAEKEPDRKKWEKKFFDIMDSLEFLPNSPTLMNSGKLDGQLSGCFTLPIEDNLAAIFEIVKESALIHKTGGGTGFNFSKIRPAGTIVNSTKGVASGVVSFMSCFDAATAAVKQGGVRRGANLGLLNCDHPEIYDFISCKKDLSKFQNFNISVGMNGDFLKRAREGKNHFLINPHDKNKREVSASELMDLVCQNIWETGEPGIIFLDTINKMNPIPWFGKIDSVNPCSEANLLPWESCNLGSIDVSKFFKGGDLEWGKLLKVTDVAVRFLDNVISVNKYPRVKIARKTLATRKIGLGIMGWADLLLAMKIRYNNDEALNLAEKLMSTINNEAMRYSEQLGREKGFCPAGNGKLKRRNAVLTVIAPTGTLSMLANCLAKGTLIDTINGKIPIEKLVGGNPFVYCYDQENNRIRLGKASKVWQTSDHREISRIWFDTGDFLDATEDHLLYKNESGWEKVSNLKVGDSIKALHKNLGSVGFTGTNKVSEYKMSWESVHEEGIGDRIIHHIDGNHLNNHPDNLIAMAKSEHASLHYENRKEFFDNLRKKTWEEKMGIDKSNLRKIKLSKRMTGECNPRFGYKYDAKKRKEIGMKTKKAMERPEVREKFLAGIEKRNSNQEWLKKRHKFNQDPNFVPWNKNKKFSSRPATKENMITNNHKIVKIEKFGATEVFDIEVPIYHNFAANGILVHNCSSSIEPIFAKNFTKKVLGSVKVDLSKKYKEEVGDYFVTALEISPEWHVRMQAAFQKHISGAISKTINMPYDAKLEDIKKAIYLAYDLGCKSLTLYRNGTREAPIEISIEGLSECNSGKCQL
jgi:ribonucleotide reductase alpha subunit